LEVHRVHLDRLGNFFYTLLPKQNPDQFFEKDFSDWIKEDNVIIALYTVAILWVALGTLLIVYTEGTMDLLKRLVFMEKVRILAIFPIIFGIILIAGAFACTQIFWLSFILGLLAFMKGLYLLMGPLSQIRGLIDWWFTQASDSVIRLCGLIVFVLGIVMISNLP